MFRKIDWHSTVIWAAVAAFIWTVPAFIYTRQGDYSQSWLLYLGTGLFFFTMALYTVRESFKRGGNESTVALVFASHVTTIVAILMCCVVVLLLLATLVPGYFSQGQADKILVDEPPQILNDRTHGLSFHLFVSATLLNFFGGSIAGVTIPFYAKRNQSKDNREPVPLQQKSNCQAWPLIPGSLSIHVQ